MFPIFVKAWKDLNKTNNIYILYILDKVVPMTTTTDCRNNQGITLNLILILKLLKCIVSSNKKYRSL